MSTKYPSFIDDNLSLPKVIDLVSPVLAGDVNRLQEAIIAIEKELGASPSGTYGSIKDRLNNVFAELFASNVRVLNSDGYYADTGDGYATVESALQEIGAALEILTQAGGIAAGGVILADTDGYYDSTTVEGALQEIGSDIDFILTAGGAVIGLPEDGSYEDGLFTNFASSTPVGTAVDRFNEVLKSLAPSPAPSLSDMSWASFGPEGKVSFGPSNSIAGYTNVGTLGGPSSLDINGTFSTGGQRTGIFAAGTTMSGTLADSVPQGSGSPTPAYPANAFGDADQGLLQLFVNGTKIHEVDLSAFVSGTTTTSGSGFTLSEATAVSFPNGDPFEIFQYRTGTWTAAATHQRNGWNYVQVIHDLGSTQRQTNYFEWVVDADTTATNFPAAAEVVSNLAMVSTSKFISGVEYHTAGSFEYDVQIENCHRNTYSNSSSAIYFTSSTNVNTSGTGEELGTTDGTNAIIDESNNRSIANKVFSIQGDNAGRILNGSVIVRATVDRTVQSDLTSPNLPSFSGILFDSNSDTATATNEPLNGERFRVPSNRSLSDTTGFTNTGAGLWDTTISLVSATAGYSDGLLVYDGGVVYPSSSQVANSGNFSTITNGPGNSGQPGAVNPDYSAASGTRFFWRYFYFPDPAAVKNFTLAVSSTNTSFVTVGSGLTGNNVYVEILLPSQTQGNGTDGGGSTVSSGVCFKDCRASYTDDNGSGALDGTFNATNWPLTTGTKSTALSGNTAIIRVTAASTWAGKITNISLVQR